MRRNRANVMRFRHIGFALRRRRSGVPYRQKIALQDYRSERFKRELIERK